MTGPLGEGGQTITMETLSLPSPPPPHLSECGAGRGEVGVLKTEQRWQLSLQSWWDEVISLSCCNWWALGWSNFTFFFKCLQRGLSQQGLNSYPKLSFPSKLIYFTDRLAHLAFYTSEIKKKRGAQLVSRKNRSAGVSWSSKSMILFSFEVKSWFRFRHLETKEESLGGRGVLYKKQLTCKIWAKGRICVTPLLK